MIARHIVILTVFILIIDTAYSIPKLKRKATGKHYKFFARQGLPESGESTEGPNVEENNDQLIEEINDDGGTYPNPQQENDQGDENLNQNNDADQEDNQTPLDPSDDAKLVGPDDDNDAVILGQLDKIENNVLNQDRPDEYGDINSTEYESDQTDEYLESAELGSDEKLNLKQDSRSIQVGDTFTVKEMLQIAKHLMKKVRDHIGKGKGIVSSATHPKNLADNLFDRYFMTMKRIVILKDDDIPGIDALQALALSGSAVNGRSIADSITESPSNVNGEHTIEEFPIRKCHYKLIKKRVHGRKNALRKNSQRRRRVDLSKKLAKNRKLVVNPSRRGPKGMKSKNRKPRKIITKGNKKIKKINIRSNKREGSKAKDVCRWMYECKNNADLSSCRLHADCSQEAKSGRKYLGLKLNENEHTDTLKQFRKMVGVDVIDEEVEKILARRYLSQGSIKLSNSEKIESLADYFNKIVINEQLDEMNTTPYPLEATIDVANAGENTTENIRKEVTSQPDQEGVLENGEPLPENEGEPQDQGKYEIIPETGEEPEQGVVENGEPLPENEGEPQDQGKYEIIPETGEEPEQSTAADPEPQAPNVKRRIIPGILTTTKKPKYFKH